MCEPVSIGFAALAVVGTVVQMQGQAQQARAAQTAANFQSQVARNNAIIAQRAADAAREQGEVEGHRRRLLTKQVQGEQRVGAAAQGQVVGEGSALDLEVDAVALGELDVLTIRHNAERRALGFEVQANNFASEASLLLFKSASTSQAARTQQFGTLLTGIAGAGGALKFSGAGAVGAPGGGPGQGPFIRN